MAEAIASSDKSARQISKDAGVAPGYVSGILTENKEPSIARFLRICDEIPANPVYILYGVSAEPGDEEILKALRDNPEARRAILALISQR